MAAHCFQSSNPLPDIYLRSPPIERKPQVIFYHTATKCQQFLLKSASMFFSCSHTLQSLPIQGKKKTRPLPDLGFQKILLLKERMGRTPPSPLRGLDSLGGKRQKLLPLQRKPGNTGYFPALPAISKIYLIKRSMVNHSPTLMALKTRK